MVFVETTTDWRESYSPIAMVIPYGAGAKFKINPSLNIGVEAGIRWVFSDYLDDASGKYDPSISKENGDSDIRVALADRREEYLNENVFKNDGVITSLKRANSNKTKTNCSILHIIQQTVVVLILMMDI